MRLSDTSVAPVVVELTSLWPRSRRGGCQGVCERRTARLLHGCNRRHGARSTHRGRLARGDGVRPREVALACRPRRRLGIAAHSWPHGDGRRGSRRRRDRGSDAATAPRRERRRMSELARVEATTLNGTDIVRVVGEIDLSNASQVRDAIGAAVPDLAAAVIVDLSHTRYLDSAGIAMFFRLAERLTYNRQEL